MAILRGERRGDGTEGDELLYKPSGRVGGIIFWRGGISR